MKMIILIVKDNDSDEVTQALIADQYRVTRVASTGGFPAKWSCYAFTGRAG